ncbi:DUF4365 domain-containing protein [Nonomuraea dietziae]|uniref:DUF4365 domain-containing protein n=1 Tax=Nonomuraea dietziae TaxID=65515 RepID=UPI00343ADCAF
MLQEQWGLVRTSAGIPYGTLHQTECKQQFSLAFTHAITAAARCTIADLRVDVERIDYTVRQSATHRKYTSSQVDVQMKCTDQDVLRDDGLHWSLSRDHYDWLRDPKTYNRKILVVLHVPRLLQDWLQIEEEGMLLRKVAYWVCLEGAEPVDTKTTTVVLPRTNVFSVPSLLGILQKVGDGGVL